MEFEEMTTLSDDDIVFILNAWEEGGYIVLHEPQQGQMSMKQAITAGLDWIASLSEQEILPSFLKEGYGFNQTSANLSTIEMRTKSFLFLFLLKLYYKFLIPKNFLFLPLKKETMFSLKLHPYRQISMQSSEFILQKEEDKKQTQEKNEMEFEEMTISFLIEIVALKICPLSA